MSFDLVDGPDAEALRRSVRNFLEAHWHPAGETSALSAEGLRLFRRAAVERGFLYRNVPRRFGGAEQEPNVIHAQVIREEFGRAGAPMEVPGNGVTMLVPTLLEHGTEEQCRQFIPKTLDGDYRWGQGYSEPEAGSDLAAVRSRAVVVGDKWIINGQKIWTSQGRSATHMFMLVRTDPGAPKHAGLSYILVDLDQPGIIRRPIRQMTGESGFYEFFFTDAETPLSWTVGVPGQGWVVSRTTLKHERAAIGSSERLMSQFAKLVALARETGRLRDPQVRDELARIEGFVLAHRFSSYRLLSCAAAQEDPGVLALMMKLFLTEIGHDIARLAQQLMGDHALMAPAAPGTARRGPEKWLDQVMGSLGNSIAGGTSNIQRNIIAERGLGLPRDRAAAVGQ